MGGQEEGRSMRGRRQKDVRTAVRTSHVIFRCLTNPRFANVFQTISLADAPKNLFNADVARSLGNMAKLTSLTLPKSAWGCPAQRTEFLRYLPGKGRMIVHEV